MASDTGTESVRRKVGLRSPWALSYRRPVPVSASTLNENTVYIAKRLVRAISLVLAVVTLINFICYLVLIICWLAGHPIWFGYPFEFGVLIGAPLMLLSLTVSLKIIQLADRMRPPDRLLWVAIMANGGLLMSTGLMLLQFARRWAVQTG